MHDIDKLARSLQPHYSKFNVANRLLFTGHSHQAWPDVAFDGVNDYMQLVAEDVDLKWEKAFEQTEILRSYLRNFYDDPDGLYCREQNTHVLLVSWLSSLDLKNKPKILTTDGEFHSLYRQLRRLEEEGLTVLRLNHHPPGLLFEEIKANLDHKTSAVMLSRVYFESARINTRLQDVARLCREYDVPLLIDDYHGTNVVPLSIRESGLKDCYLMIGGYKYLQWGEANCFLRFPKDCRFRPVVTGWFSSFQTLDQPRSDGPVSFDEGDQRFATGTYDPVSQFRAAAVVRFFREQKLTPHLLSTQYSAQVAYLRDLFSSLDINQNLIRLTLNDPPDRTGGFLSLTSVHARDLRKMLLDLGIFTDARDQILRIGPAPYTTKSQCKQVIEALKACLKKFE